MGMYLNPDNISFKKAKNKEIYVNKSLLIEKIWNHSKDINEYICISRPRRFGETIDANMLVVYVSKGCNSKELFKYLNKHNVIFLNMQNFLSKIKLVTLLVKLLIKIVVYKLKKLIKQQII